MGRRRLYCATLRARRTKRLDQRHEIDRDRDETLLLLETVSRPRPHLCLSPICNKSFVGWGSHQTPLGELTALLQIPQLYLLP